MSTSTTTTAPIDKPGTPANPGPRVIALKPEGDPRPDGGDSNSPGPKPN